MIEWKNKKKLTASGVAVGLRPYDDHETIYIRNMTEDAYFVKDTIHLSAYPMLRHFRMEQRFVTSAHPITDYDRVYCRKCNQDFEIIGMLDYHFYKGSCPEF
jgi:hypothetical protein